MPCRIGKDGQIVEIEGIYGCKCLLKSSDSQLGQLGCRRPEMSRREGIKSLCDLPTWSLSRPSNLCGGAHSVPIAEA
jgi:hypothetical protein